MPNKYLDSVGLAEYTSLVKADLATKAPLASPALIGTPTAPTPTAGDDSTKIANTEFVQDAIDAEETRADGAYLPFTGGSITGNLSVSGTITGDVTGDLTGNADTATNATNDGNGDEIATTYLPLSGGTLTGDVFAPTPTAGDNSKKLANTEFIQALASILVPTGCVQAYAGNTVPDGWLLCDGSAVSRTDYADLYAVIGDTYGSGDGSTTFNLPNLVDKFIEGGTTVGNVKSAGLPDITGSVGVRGLTYNSFVSSGNGALSAESVYSGFNKSNATTASGTDTNRIIRLNASNSNSIYGNSTTVQPPALTMRYIIKY